MVFPCYIRKNYQNYFEDSVKISKKQKENEGQNLSTSSSASALLLFSVLCIDYHFH